MIKCIKRADLQFRITTGLADYYFIFLIIVNLSHC